MKSIPDPLTPTPEADDRFIKNVQKAISDASSMSNHLLDAYVRHFIAVLL